MTTAELHVHVEIFVSIRLKLLTSLLLVICCVSQLLAVHGSVLTFHTIVGKGIFVVHCLSIPADNLQFECTLLFFIILIWLALTTVTILFVSNIHNFIFLPLNSNFGALIR